MPEDIDEVRRTCGLQRDVSRQSCALKRRKLTRGRGKREPIGSVPGNFPDRVGKK